MLGTVQRAGQVLDLFRDRPEWGATAVAGELDMAKSQAHELLTTLCFIGLLRRSGRGRYRLGWGTVSLGGALLRQEFRGEAAISVRRVAARCGETTWLVALDRASVVVLAHCSREGQDGAAAPPADDQLHCTAAGKLLLAMQEPAVVDQVLDARGMRRFTRDTITSRADLRRELTWIRQRQLSFDRGETSEGRRGIAMPILDSSGGLLAALSLTSDAASWNRREREFAAVLGAECRLLNRWLRRTEEVTSPSRVREPLIA